MDVISRRAQPSVDTLVAVASETEDGLPGTGSQKRGGGTR